MRVGGWRVEGWDLGFRVPGTQPSAVVATGSTHIHTRTHTHTLTHTHTRMHTHTHTNIHTNTHLLGNNDRLVVVRYLSLGLSVHSEECHVRPHGLEHPVEVLLVASRYRDIVWDLGKEEGQ